MDDRNHKQNEINKKYILSYEYKSIVEDTAKLQKETIQTTINDRS